ncbi:MAG TPA: histidine phosphatase family protein [Gemmataceae bacterium]|nr:histidine phosphatase family protein [Gemmataceae bacterium]
MAASTITRVLLIRHAETARPDVFHGYESDADLGPRGERQAAALAPVVAALEPDVLISSGMLRARRTAEAIARATQLSIQIEPDLHERKVGDLRGLPVRGEFGVWPETLARWVAGETWYAPPGAESFDQVKARVMPVWDRVTSEKPGKTLAIVAHGIVCRVILVSVIAGYNSADWPRLGRIPNASITDLVGSGRSWRAERIGHVPDEVRKAHEAEEVRPPG